MSLKQLGNKIARGINKNADVILTVSALVGLTTTTYLAVKETPRAIDILDSAKESIDRIDEAVEQDRMDEDEAEEKIREVKIDTAKKLAKNYAGAGISFATTAGCIIGSNKASRSQNAALSSALNAATLIHSEYQERVREELGEKKETKIHDEIRKEHIDTNPPTRVDRVYDTGKGDTLCYIEMFPGDSDTGIYFYSSPEAVLAGINDANAHGIENCYVSMQDLLWFLGLKIKGHGTNLIGWQITSRSELIQVRRSSHLYNDKPVFDISFYNYPYKNFDRFG